MNIVCPIRITDSRVWKSNNVQNGTPAARGSFPKVLPERMPGTSAARGLPGCFSLVDIPIFRAVLPVSAPSDNDWALGVGSQPASEFPTLIRDGTSDRPGWFPLLFPVGMGRPVMTRGNVSRAVEVPGFSLTPLGKHAGKRAACGGGAILDIVCISVHSPNLNPQGKQCLGWLPTGTMLGQPGSAKTSSHGLSSRPRELCDRAEGSMWIQHPASSIAKQ